MAQVANQTGAEETVKLQGPNGKTYDIPKSKLASMPPALRKQLQPVSQQPQPQAGGGGQPQGGMQPMSFMQGVGAGLNPFHGAPQGMPQVPGGIQPTNIVGKTVADMANLREISARAGSGNLSGAIGEGVGTAASLAGPELLKGVGKGLKAAGEAGRALKDVPMVAKAADRATDLARQIRVSPEAARLAERFVQPLHEALDAKFETVHKALEKYSVPISGKGTQLIRRLQKSEIPAINKIGEELTKRTALDYREAEGLRRELMHMVSSGKAEHWSPQLRQLAEEVDGEIDKIAKQAKMLKKRETYRSLYNQIRQTAQAAAADAKTRATKLRGMIDAGAGLMGKEDATGILAGVRQGGQLEYKLSATAKAAGERLAKKLGVDPKMLEAGAESGKEVWGKWMNRLSHGWQEGQAAMRGVQSVMSSR